MTNEAFLFELAKDYPNIIWDNIPDLASMSWEEEPHVYQVHYKCVEFGSVPGRVRYRECVLVREFATYDAAERQVAKMSDWAEILDGSFDIRQDVSTELLGLYELKKLRDRVLAGEQVFQQPRID